MGPKRIAPIPKGPPKAKIPKKLTGIEDFSVIIDTQIINEEYGANLTSQLTENNLKYQIRNQLHPQSISFERTNSESGNCDEEHVLLLILKGSDVANWIEQDILIPTIKSYKETYPEKKISLLIFGFRKFLRNSRSKLSRIKIETEFTRLQITTKISHRLIEKPDVLVHTVVHFGKSVAEIPIKKQKHEILENENFYFDNDKKDCVRVVDSIGFGRLWQQHLIKLPWVTLETAEAIMSEYPMPRNLLDAFKASPNPESLLRDIPCRRGGGGPLMTNRRIGPEMSRKIYLFYHSQNGQELLHSS